MAENRPAVPPTCTMGSPPERNLGSVARRTPRAGLPRCRRRRAPARHPAAAAARRARPAAGPCPSRHRGTPERARATRRAWRRRRWAASDGRPCGGRRRTNGPANPTSRDSWSTTPRGPSPANRVTADAAGRHAALHRQRLPRRARFVLGEAERVLARVAERGAVDLARSTAADVAHHELQRPSDRGVGPVALTEGVAAGVHADPLGDRSVDDDDRAAHPRRGQQPVHVELVGAGGFDRGEHHRQVLGPAPGHHRVDRHLLDRALDEVGRHDGHHLVGGAGGAVEHAQHPCLGRRHHREAVGPAPFVQRLDRILERRQVDAAAVATPSRRSARAARRRATGPACASRTRGATPADRARVPRRRPGLPTVAGTSRRSAPPPCRPPPGAGWARCRGRGATRPRGRGRRANHPAPRGRWGRPGCRR